MANTEGISPAYAAQLLNSTFRGAAFPTPFAACYVKFYLDHPGPLGLANPAAYTTRTLCSFAAASTTLGTIANNILLTHSTVPATELWKFFGCFTTVGPSGGTFFWSGSVNGGVGASVSAGTSPTTAIGELIPSFTDAS